MSAAPDLLLVEDDAELAGLVRRHFEDAGYTVRHAETGPAGLYAVEERVPDLVLLDVMLPELDGMEVCRRLRAEHPLLYVIMLTARSSEIDRVVGLEVGADDYVTKPFSLQELQARVRSALRRIRLTSERSAPEEEESAEIIELGGLHIDSGRRLVELDGEALSLTVREFDLLYFLASNAGRPFTRTQLLDK
ncbi:MAG: response regulator transcription factor, partial [Bacteroidota bacterium]